MKNGAMQEIMGLPPKTASTLHKLADNNKTHIDATSFYNTITHQLSHKANSSDVYKTLKHIHRL